MGGGGCACAGGGVCALPKRPARYAPHGDAAGGAGAAGDGAKATLEQKLRYLKEVENIHALSKKVKPPAGKSWSDVADQRMRFIMGQPILEPQASPMQVRSGKLHHEHDERSSRLIERTLKLSLIHI